MQELLDKTLREVIGAWRFRWYGILLAWAVFLLGWGATAVLPDSYEATARVFVDSTSSLRPVLNNQVNQIIPADVAIQLSYVRQALLGRPQLERVARANGLDADAASPIEFEATLADLRESIRITSRDNTNTVYSISYRSSDREQAIGVVATLLNALEEDTIGANQEGADTASRFLEERIADYEQRLQHAETALAEFKRRNSDRLPATQGGYFERLRLARDNVSAGERELRLAVSRRDRIQEQLSSESPVMPAGTETITEEPEPNSLDARIRDYRAQLDALLLQYTDLHPDVINAKEALTRLEAQRAEQLRALGVLDPNQELSSLGTNPVYQSLRIALNEANVEIAAIEADVGERRAEANRLQALIEEVPEVEAELARLNRDYNVIYEQYQSLVRSRETQDLSERAQDADQVQFRTIDPPLADFAPVAPNRLLLLAGVFMAALGAGGALCWLLSQLSPVFTSASILREVCGLPVLGTVSYAAPLSRWRGLSVVGFAAALGALTMLFGAAVVVELGPGIRSLVGLA
jgi:polysaccharide chain length determinant protein (PEP-CTERM system associated)